MTGADVPVGNVVGDQERQLVDGVGTAGIGAGGRADVSAPVAEPAGGRGVADGGPDRGGPAVARVGVGPAECRVLGVGVEAVSYTHL